jgi:Fe2+ transport system protein FeoA
MSTLTELKPGQSGQVNHLDLPEEVRGKLLELGLCPGETLRVVRRSPFGDPIEIEILGYRLALRRSEADGIHIVCP